MATILERLTGTGDARLGEWERDTTYANARAKLTELETQRTQIGETLQGARAQVGVATEAQRRTAAAALIGDGDSKAAKAAERDALTATERVQKLEQDLAATELAITTLSGRLAEYEHAARVEHVERVVRPWLDPLMAEFVPLMKRAAEINTIIHRGMKKIEEGFPADVYSGDVARFKPVNAYTTEGQRPIVDFSLKGLLIADDGAQFSTVFSDWWRSVKAAGYDR